MTDLRCEGNAVYIEVDGVLLQFSRGGAVTLAHRILNVVQWESSHTTEDIGVHIDHPIPIPVHSGNHSDGLERD